MRVTGPLIPIPDIELLWRDSQTTQTRLRLG
jgi:hypothetical protein